MWLTIDIGNSRIKTALFDNNELIVVRSSAWSETWEECLAEDLRAYRPVRIGVSSVVPAQQVRVRALLERISNLPILAVHHGLSLPFALKYRTPGTLGADRLAAAAAAWHCYSQGLPTVIVDAGTALTVDVIRDGQFLGGSIAVGPELEGRTLARGTAALPRVSACKLPGAVGMTTNEALQSGLLYGLIDRVRGSVERLTSVLGKQRVVVVTGGWHAFLHQHIAGINHVDPDLVLRGVRHLMVLNPV